MSKKTFSIGDNRIGMSNLFQAQVVERRPGHPEEGKVVSETPFASNLILTSGLDRVAIDTIPNMFRYCAIGTGTTPTEDDSGAVKAQTTGATCNSDGAFFTLGDVGKLLRFDTGEKSIIVAYVDGDTVTLADTLNVSVDTLFTMYRVAQVGLATETKRTGTMLAGSCGSVRSGNLITMQRTFDFPVEVSDQSYHEVGFSHSATVAGNLNTRGLFTSAPVSVVTGQQLRVVYYFVVTIGPTSPVSKEITISGWPSLEHPVAVDSGTDRISLTGHGFTAGTPITFDGVTPPSPLSFGTTYYVVNTAADSFQVEASLGGGAIDFLTTGTGVILFTNTLGTEQLSGIGIFAVDSNGNTYPLTADIYGYGKCPSEPSVDRYCFLSTTATAHPTWPVSYSASGMAAISGTTNNYMTPATYVGGSFTQTYSATFAVSEGNSSAIRRICITGDSNAGGAEGINFLFNHDQEKTSLFTLSITMRQTWDRDFV